MIRIAEMIEPECVFLGLAGDDKQTVLEAMTDRLQSLGRIQDGRAIHRLLMDREALMTTAVRHGYAFPHAFSPQLDHTFLAIGAVSGGVPFDALDGEPVQFVFLLLGPSGNQAVHLRVLARISRLTARPDMLERLQGAASSEDLVEMINDCELQLQVFPYDPVSPS